MKALTLLSFLLLVLLLVQIPAQAQESNWDTLVDRFFDQADFRFNPSAGTSAGFHQYDSQLEDFSNATIQQQIAMLHRYEEEVSQFPARQLTPEQTADRDLVLGNIRSWLLDL